MIVFGSRKILDEGATTYKTAEDFENYQLKMLNDLLRQLIKQEASV